MALLVLFAFVSGVVTIVSPCVLPVLPMLLSTSVTGGRWRPLGIVTGFAMAFAVATLVLSAVLQAIGLPQDWLRILAIVALALFGLSMLVPLLGRSMEGLLAPLARRGSAMRGESGFGGGVLMGAGLGLVWSPCVGPIMASTIALAVTSGASSAGTGITLAYALGAAMPMLAIAYGARRFASGSRRIRPGARAIRQIFGGLTVVTAVLLLLGLQSSVQSLLPTDWSNTLAGFERSQVVQQQLDKLQASSPDAPSHAPIAAAANSPTPLPALAMEPSAQENTPAPPNEPVVAPSATPAREQAMFDFPKPDLNLPDKGPAPELTGLKGWINSEPLSIKGLRGKVVIVDFWTFECYNCANTRPYVRALYDKYHSQGLEILGIHTPEFAFERVPENVAKAAKEQGVNWPIGLDPDYKTWSAYNNRYWPAFYFIDAGGRLRYEHFGEGNYDYNEKVVQQLLYEAKSAQ